MSSLKLKKWFEKSNTVIVLLTLLLTSCNASEPGITAWDWEPLVIQGDTIYLPHGYFGYSTCENDQIYLLNIKQNWVVVSYGGLDINDYLSEKDEYSITRFEKNDYDFVMGSLHLKNHRKYFQIVYRKVDSSNQLLSFVPCTIFETSCEDSDSKLIEEFFFRFSPAVESMSFSK